MLTALFIVGVILIFVGLAMILLAPKAEKTHRGAQARGLDPAEILKQFAGVLDKVDRKYRIGLCVIALGATLALVAAFLEAKDAKDEAKKPAPAAALALRL